MLSEAVCNKIAAGEVVERPASVVKELVENGLDAGAGKILVAVEKAGSRCIRIVDDGEGMDEDDAMLCFESHATSKIVKEDDIFTISSFGFRGEAMPSIASVSKMSIRTRRRDAASGVEVLVHGGKMIASNPTGCAPGTEVIVKDLFYNIPARKKFLKSNATEERHILDCVSSISLAHPGVTFEVKVDGRTFLSSPASTSLIPRIRELFGKEYADALVPVSQTENGITVSGYISKRNFTRASRADQRIFVNGRSIESQAVYRGIKEGCGPMLEKGRYQAAILFLRLDPKLVDVNVHPTKQEVRFYNDLAVTSAVRQAVMTALRLADPVIPYIQNPDNRGLEKTVAPSIYSAFSVEDPSFKKDDSGTAATTPEGIPEHLPPSLAGEADSLPSEPVSPMPELQKQGVSHGISDLSRIMRAAYITYQPVSKDASGVPEEGSASVLFGKDFFRTSADAEKTEKQSVPQDDVSRTEKAEPERQYERDSAEQHSLFSPETFRFLGLMENSYLVGTIADGLVLIDQHAAHERVLYERILKGVDGSLSQRLLLPIIVEISRADMLFVIRNTSAFESIGYEIEPFGQNTVKLNGIPAALPQNNAGGMFTDILSRLAENGSVQTLTLDRIARAACKAAVKAHDHLTLAECEALIRQMGKCEQPFACPHGRPTVLNISLNEIERRFGRK